MDMEQAVEAKRVKETNAKLHGYYFEDLEEGMEDAYAKIKAGAHAIQLYSALAYQGLSLVDDIARGLDRMLAADGHDHISTAIGTETENWL